MPRIALTDDQLIIHLNPAEKLAAFHGDVKVNGIAIRGAAVASKRWWLTLGLRVPGTALPGVIIAGTYLWRRDNAFVYWTLKSQPLEITLADKMSPAAKGTHYTRIIIGVPNAQEWADKINDAIVSC
jgi:hypothetical protein